MQKFQKSAELFEHGLKVMPAGSPASRILKPFPIYVDRGQGAIKWDVDGNEIVDYFMGSGALLLGYDHPVVMDAIRERLGKGTHVVNSPLAIEWGEQVMSMIPSAERVRFTGSGTESTYLAVRLARAYTGKKRLITFRRHYHGWNDYVVLGSDSFTENGIPEEAIATMTVVQPEISAVEQVLSEDDDVAAVIVESTGAHFGQFPLQNPDFLQGLRAVTARHDVVMIMDEVVTGFRASRGGTQARYGITPDLTTLSKVLCGGLPGGAVVGKADILDLISSENRENRVGNSGTFNGNPLSATAGIAALRLIASEPINERADATAERLKQGLVDSLSRMEVRGHVHGIASMVHLALGVECDCGGGVCPLPHDQIADAVGPAQGLDRHGRVTTRSTTDLLRMSMLNEGVELMIGTGFMVSAVHTDEHIDRTIEAFEKTLVSLRDEGAV